MKLIDFDYDKYVKNPDRYKIYHYRTSFYSSFSSNYSLVPRHRIEFPINIVDTYFIRVNGLSFTKDGFFEFDKTNPAIHEHIKMSEIRRPMFHEAD